MKTNQSPSSKPHPSHALLTASVVALWICLPLEHEVKAEETDRSSELVSFSREILPILADKCFVCHGPDSHPDTDLRLDSVANATADRGGMHAVDQENPLQSELLARIGDKQDPMPPIDAEKQLSDEERDLLGQWIRQGGNYASHWAWIPPTKTGNHSDTTLAIDHFIGQSLEKEGITFAPQATLETLARRTSFILTGLPPEPEWVDTLRNDSSPKAFEHFVDRLLSSERYGEHQARYWLDAVRYGDTHGLHLDNRRGIYPYRDWVVRALNDNLPLNQFITWQLAGDLLPEPSMEQRIATGFIRMNPSTGEGGAIPAEFQIKNNFDRVENFGTVFLGLSLTCARCHTHKYDPIEQREYYELLSFFNNTSEPALDGNSYTYGSTLSVPADQAAWKRWKRLNTEAQTLLREHFERNPPDFKSANQYAKQATAWAFSDWKSTKPNSSRPIDNKNNDTVTTDESNLDSASSANAKSDLKQASPYPQFPIDGFPGTLTGGPAKGRLPGAGEQIEVTVDIQTKTKQTIGILFSGAENSSLAVNDAAPSIVKTSNADAASQSIVLPSGKHRLVFKIMGHGGMDSLTIDLKTRWDALSKSQDWAVCDRVDQLRMVADSIGPLFAEASDNADPNFSNRAATLAENLESEKLQFTTSLVAKELPKPRITHVLRRGEYDLPVGDPVNTSTPAILGGWSKELPANRVGLAQWATARENPLVTRVLVNRIWQRVFGNAIVRTPEDFGVQGQQPTHPKLLDWLAVEMHDSQWNLKKMLRSMVLSRTFRQSSTWRADLDDPENKLLARAASYRMDAEVLRDVGLWAAGILNPEMGGEGIKPYQPPGMWLALAHPGSNTKNYQTDQGDRLNRRSLYVYWKRTSPHPMMTLFDAPDRESSCVRRSRTNTPLQSLGMLNETQRVEISRVLATRLLNSDADDVIRIEKLFQMITCRTPNASEKKACLDLLSEMRARYKASPEDAKQLLNIGKGGNQAPNTSQTFSTEDLAAWSLMTSTFLASDLTIMLY